MNGIPYKFLLFWFNANNLLKCRKMFISQKAGRITCNNLIKGEFDFTHGFTIDSTLTAIWLRILQGDVIYCSQKYLFSFLLVYLNINIDNSQKMMSNSYKELMFLSFLLFSHISNSIF